MVGVIAASTPVTPCRRSKFTSEFVEPLIGLRAAIAEEDLSAEPHQSDNFCSQFTLRAIQVEIGNMDQLGRLFGNRFCHGRMTVTERADRNSCTEIEIGLTRLIPDTTPLAACQGEIKPPIGRHDEIVKKFGGRKCAHGIKGS